MIADDDTKSGMASERRHVYGPRALSALVPHLTRPAFRRRAPAAAQVLADWAAIVGPALAGQTSPRRLHGGTLVIACGGPVAMELQHLAPELIARINTHLGRRTVDHLRFVQDLAAAAPLPARAAPAPSVITAAERAVADLPPGELRDALAALGRAVIAPGPPDASPSRRHDPG